MRALGVVLILCAATGGYLENRRRAKKPIAVGQALLEDLALLRYEVCVRRAPLPWVLTHTLAGGDGARYFWMPLHERLSRRAPSLPRCWAETAASLPDPLPRLIAPLGELLPAGGENLAKAIDETREELTGVLRILRERQADGGRLAAALCFSAAFLLILVLW